MSRDLGMWVAGIATVIAFSVLWKPTKPYNLLQHAYVGMAGGYGVTLGVENIMKVGWNPLVKGDYKMVIPIVLGIMLLTRYYRPYRWLSGYPVAMLVGIGTGLSVRGIVSAEILSQITATMIKLNSFDNLVIIFCTLTTTIYFIFTIGVGERGPLGSSLATLRSLGRYSLLVMFGAAFAMSVQGRLSLLIGRFQFLFQELLGL
ncbi:MAG: hypothetical protein Q8P50_02345 [Bacillota bacterium]|nr:hypothetical protein [Bacillota bacterium]